MHDNRKYVNVKILKCQNWSERKLDTHWRHMQINVASPAATSVTKSCGKHTNFKNRQDAWIMIYNWFKSNI